MKVYDTRRNVGIVHKGDVITYVRANQIEWQTVVAERTEVFEVPANTYKAWVNGKLVIDLDPEGREFYDKGY